MKEVVIVSAARTAVGNFNGSLASLSAPELGATRSERGDRKGGDKGRIG